MKETKPLRIMHYDKYVDITFPSKWAPLFSIVYLLIFAVTLFFYRSYITIIAFVVALVLIFLVFARKLYIYKDKRIVKYGNLIKTSFYLDDIVSLKSETKQGRNPSGKTYNLLIDLSYNKIIIPTFSEEQTKSLICEIEMVKG